MTKRTRMAKLDRLITVRSTVCLGLALLLIAAVISSYVQVRLTTQLAVDTMATLHQQCVSFNKLTTADRTKSLFRLADMMRDLRSQLARNPSLATDAQLEEYVDSMLLSGIAVLDGNAQLEASGYTRTFQDANWIDMPDYGLFTDIMQKPEKIFLERVHIGGEYYDLCILARQDAPGVLVGFYRQPSGLISGMENDLESLLSGLQLERGGHYAIAENGNIRVTSDSIPTGMAVSDSALLSALSGIRKDGMLHLFRAQGNFYLGFRSSCEQYQLYIYYPALTVISSAFAAVALFTVFYCAICLLYFAVRNQMLRENQASLRKSNEELKQTVNMLHALETIYFSLFYVDLEQDSYSAIYIAPWLRDSVPQSSTYTSLKQRFVSGFVVPAFRAEVDQRMSISFIQETLNRENISDVHKSFYTDYQAIRGDQNPCCRVTPTTVDYDASGRPHHVLALLQDIDKEKTRESDYQAQIRREAHEAKVANNAKTDFLRRMSHDIRTPVNGIQGYLDLANSRPEDSELQAHCREKIATALHTLLAIINSVLDMSKLESGEIALEKEPFNLTELLENVNAILIPQAAARGVHYEVSPMENVTEPYLIGSPLHLSQVIMNIASNAVKYTQAGGSVHMNTSLLSRTEDAATYAFVCEDNGIGMSADFQQHMYEPFAQEVSGARTRYEGTGLGLAIVKRLVDAMGGVITCHSAKGVGTTFRIELTFRIDHQPEKSVPDAAQAAEDALAGRRILLAEDNELNMEIAEFLLTGHGAKITKAWNGREAVDLFAASAPEEFDLILMDLMMPEMNGLEAASAIRAMDRPDAKTVPISAMSANSFPDDVERSLAAGMNAHISKPIDMQKLIAAVAGLMKKRI